MMEEGKVAYVARDRRNWADDISGFRAPAYRPAQNPSEFTAQLVTSIGKRG